MRRERLGFTDDVIELAVPPVPKKANREVKAIMDEVVVLDLTFHRAGIRRKADISKVETGAKKDQLGLTKAIVDSKEYAAAMSVTGEARGWVDRRSLPSPLKRGTYLVPITMVAGVNDYLDQVEQRYLAKAEEFCRAYPDLVRRAKVDLADQFDADNYPSVGQLRRSFWVERRLLDFGVPSEAKIGKALWQQEKARAEATWSSAVDEIQVALRDAFRSLVGHLAERLEPNADGSRKVFRDTAIEKLLEFIDLFKSRNLTGDADLEGLIIQARNVLKGRNVKALRDNATARGEVAGEMARVMVAMDKLLEDAPRRKISFEDD